LTNATTTAVIYQAHISVIIVGTGEKRWTAFSFADTYFDPDEEPGEDEFSYQLNMADPIISGGYHDANKPDWNPRAYFLMSVRNRLEQVSREWHVLVRQVEAGLKNFRENHPSLTRSIGAPRNLDEDLLDPFKWVMRTYQLANDLSEYLAKTNDAWSGFVADDGDIQYFFDSEVSSPDVDDTISNSLRDIKDFFDELKTLHRELESCSRICEDYSKLVNFHQLHFTRESNQAVQQNRSASDITILAISPIAVVSTVFAIPTNIMTFKRNFKTFFVSVIVMALGLQILGYLLVTWRKHIVRNWRHWWRRLQTRKENLILDTSESGTAAPELRPPSTRSNLTERVDTMDTLVPGAIPLREIQTV
jgi:hypothetical protein